MVIGSARSTDRGRVIWGDQILMLLAGPALAEHPGAPIVADVKASQALFDHIEALGGQPVMWKTGHSLMKTKMIETGAPLGGEMSAISSSRANGTGSTMRIMPRSACFAASFWRAAR